MRSWERAKLRKAALRYVEHGWHVLPGAYLVGQHAGRHAKERRFVCGEIGCRTVACHPAARVPSRSPAVVAGWWRKDPWTVLFPTGYAFDVLEVPAALGRAALLGDGLVAARGPVAVARPGQGERWHFLVLPGHGLLPELAQQPGVVLHGQGSWVPAPPSPQFGGRVRWELPPEAHGWRPAEPYAVQALMLDAIGAGPLTAAGQRATWRTAA
ncbi:bifunctional DNA primase/polymerase [Dactylosporangium aurantiacum]|uniref:Bifunctional DNA primase/polymerase n=1 Tax=Dactylosporangium aurantiacum TaxID=35754 RepID=A0A9Q9IHQ9_9ACTN|nr:bifunctional DNA primase/polymerase [Dactylosporangium aurantiacum]MDG6102333.1 bifunctional DNA primase/polymerase [Dactylosporangium aurantiacum]UWZ53368.1 bifunctional DNA primase/polymerase [Dactylosporangium aurantiacum]